MKTRVRTTSKFIVKPENKVVEEIEVNHVKKLSE